MTRLRILLALLLAFSWPPTVARAQSDTLRYEFHYEPDAGQGARVAVDLRFRGSRSGRTGIVIPTSWAGEDSLGRAIVGFDAGPDVEVSGVSAGQRLLTHLRGARIHIHYVLRQDWAGRLRYPQYHRVIVDSARVVFNESNGLIYPEHAAGETLVVQYQWSGLPVDWRILTSFGQKASFSGPASWRELASASFAAGAFRLISAGTRVGGMTIEAQGNWRFSDAALAQVVQSLWTAETAFWGGGAFNHAFVLLLPISNTDVLAGTAFTAGFVA
ncbi:MAG TPA: hypothetical protein VIJ16_01080, partial [Gemmatimonadaceae bacterium]